MKKFALALTAMAAVLFGSGLGVNAYPPGAGVITITPANGQVVPGGNVTLSGACQPGEQVTASFDDSDSDSDSDGSSATTTCGAAGTGPTGSDPAAGGYTLSVAAPDSDGSYTLNVEGSSSGVLGTFTVVVATAPAPVTQGGETDDNTDGNTGGGSLPSTGSDTTSTALLIGGGALLMGLGLFGTARLRREQDLTTG